MTSTRLSQRISVLTIVAVCVIVLGCAPTPQSATDATGPASASDPLPSWNDGPAKQAIIDLVARVTDPTTADFVPEPERIATFDNDGCLWSEQPMYYQVVFAIDRVREMAADHPEIGRASSRERVCSVV